MTALEDDVEVRQGTYGEKVIAVEPGGAEFIPLSERHGRPLQLFWTWTSPNLEFATIFNGLGSDVTDSSIAAPQRHQVAALKLKTYFDQIIAGKQRARRLPASLGDVLRERVEHHVYQGGIQRGLELAQRKKAQEALDTTQTAPAAQPPAMRPAPGPAPVQGDSGS